LKAGKATTVLLCKTIIKEGTKFSQTDEVIGMHLKLEGTSLDRRGF